MESSQIIILAIIATSLATFISRFMGALTSEKVSVNSKIFQWFNCVAYSTLAALLGRMIIFPAGVLAESELFIRIAVLIICIIIFIVSKKNSSTPNYSFCYTFIIFKQYMSIEIKDHKNSKRVKVIILKESDLDKLIFPFKKHTITSLEYKPFSRFTLAKSVDEVFEGKLGEEL